MEEGEDQEVVALVRVEEEVLMLVKRPQEGVLLEQGVLLEEGVAWAMGEVEEVKAPQVQLPKMIQGGGDPVVIYLLDLMPLLMENLNQKMVMLRTKMV